MHAGKGSWAVHSLTTQEKDAAFKDKTFAHILSYIWYFKINLVILAFLLIFYWMDIKYIEYPFILNWYPEGYVLKIKCWKMVDEY